MLDTSKLEEKLASLRGLDFETAETLTRRNPANAAVVEVSVIKEFQARLAALALAVPYEDIKELPLKQYAAVCQRVVNFLFANSDDVTPAAN